MKLFIVKYFTVNKTPPEVVLLETRTPRKLREIVADHAQTAVLISVYPVIHVSLTVATVSSGNWEWETAVYNLFPFNIDFIEKLLKLPTLPLPKSQK